MRTLNPFFSSFYFKFSVYSSESLHITISLICYIWLGNAFTVPTTTSTRQPKSPNCGVTCKTTLDQPLVLLQDAVILPDEYLNVFQSHLGDLDLSFYHLKSMTLISHWRLPYILLNLIKIRFNLLTFGHCVNSLLMV